MLTLPAPRQAAPGLPKVVTFDIGDTLVRTDGGSVTKRLAEVFDRPLPLVRAFLNGRAKRERAPRADLASALCGHFGNNECRDLVITILQGAAEEAARVPAEFDDVRPVVSLLAEAGYRLAAISNLLGAVAPDPDQTRALLGLDSVFYSCDVGAVKPESGIFRHVECWYGLPPDSFLHVGDSLEADVKGAVRAGWRALHLRRSEAAATRERLPDVGGSERISSLHAVSQMLLG
ncbi:MAG TPA: HAD family hydrolase [Streptosporangiaceae bacterium]|nr:HAD family hydrolase [Streptosporangiaceae bacterium]